MEANDRENIRTGAGDVRNSRTVPAAVKDQAAATNSGDAITRAKAIARWENEGGRVVAVPREQPGRR